jgi:N-dimethylarginine dimethylaminohydrolase
MPGKPLVKPKQADSALSKEPDPNVRITNPSVLEVPAFLMCEPYSLDADNPNNVWMQDLSEEEREVDHQLAQRQWGDLYQRLAGEGRVYLIPAKMRFQDQVYCANVGIILLHADQPVAVVARYRTPPRKGEENAARILLDQMGYRVYQPSTTWEGEADLKHLRDNLYVGGYGIRTDPKSHDWFERRFDMKIIRVRMTDPHLYHFDCLLFPLTPETVLACTSLMEKSEVRALEEVVEIVPVSSELAHAAVTNSVRLGPFVLCGSSITELQPGAEEWDKEHRKVAFLERTLPKYGMEPILVNVSEFDKSGAALSCLVMHLNRASYSVPLI